MCIGVNAVVLEHGLESRQQLVAEIASVQRVDVDMEEMETCLRVVEFRKVLGDGDATLVRRTGQPAARPTGGQCLDLRRENHAV